MAGMTRKLIPCTTICSRQLVMCCLSLAGGKPKPLTRKMRPTAPYRMEYCDLMGPPCAATAVPSPKTHD